MKTVKFHGGYHNCPEIRIRVNDKQYSKLKEGFCSLEEVLSKYQMRRLEKHFCGVEGCLCGGVSRATMEP